MINQNWIFGTHAGLDFSSNPLTATSDSAISTKEGCASISDSNGNLLFYTDGQKVWDGNHGLQVSGLQGNSSSTQSAIIVPNPGNSHEYYIFTTDGSSTTAQANDFNGVKININTWVNTSLGSLMTLPSNTDFSPAEKLTAVQHKNCNDFWVITILQQGANSTLNGPGFFRVFLVNSSGVSYVGDSAMGLNINISELGYLKGSPDGQSLAISNGTENQVLVYPFDHATGIININGLRRANANRSIYGVEFSPDSKLLYFGTLVRSPSQGEIYQVDLASGPLSPIQVGSIPSAGGDYSIGALQLAPDGLIYIAKDNSTKLAAILSPSTLGAGCAVTDNHITLPNGATCELGLPNLIPNPCEDPCDCNKCTGCNEHAEEQNEELIERAKAKFNTIHSDATCDSPFTERCEGQAISSDVRLTPCFYFHWGDGHNDQIEEHDTEIFYITVCNPFDDILFTGLRITKVTLIPDIHPLDKIQIVPDRFISLDCLEPCSCQSREFAIITRATDTAGNYSLEVEYCYEGISMAGSEHHGKVAFNMEITED